MRSKKENPNKRLMYARLQSKSNENNFYSKWIVIIIFIFLSLSIARLGIEAIRKHLDTLLELKMFRFPMLFISALQQNLWQMSRNQAAEAASFQCHMVKCISINSLHFRIVSLCKTNFCCQPNETNNDLLCILLHFNDKRNETTNHLYKRVHLQNVKIDFNSTRYGLNRNWIEFRTQNRVHCNFNSLSPFFSSSLAN